ncbi:hypothetical protein N4562_06415 [Ligilactobacillus agilis]|uniref:Polysaccharide biosynthesis protein C-terminal domain-containing protein n=1 Tax=Ligilactobacillus agilis TaxID=1601 RepID=A0A9Q9MNV7_9LACO|nr:hypothetical protein [Ligilactobacillus agilis]UXC62731.1 hypothetical protein N4562_06415 [Ligilactobacillus agilis]UXC64730.1 hypothetical protein N4597_06410 [Ligilactobacillus agilis]
MVICAIENIILSVVLGGFLGVAGILFASSFSRITTYIWIEPKILFKEYFNREANRYYMKLSVNFIIVSLITFFSLIIDNIINPNNFIIFGIEFIIVFILSVGMSLFFYRKSRGMKIIISFVKNKIFK